MVVTKIKIKWNKFLILFSKFLLVCFKVVTHNKNQFPPFFLLWVFQVWNFLMQWDENHNAKSSWEQKGRKHLWLKERRFGFDFGHFLNKKCIKLHHINFRSSVHIKFRLRPSIFNRYLLELYLRQAPEPKSLIANHQRGARRKLHSCVGRRHLFQVADFGGLVPPPLGRLWGQAKREPSWRTFISLAQNTAVLDFKILGL